MVQVDIKYLHMIVKRIIPCLGIDKGRVVKVLDYAKYNSSLRENNAGDKQILRDNHSNELR
jgi:imidazole glycerol phosphate synthase subunit HisF